MKKIFGLVLVIGIIFVLVGCDSATSDKLSSSPPTPSVSISKSDKDVLQEYMDENNVKYMGKDIEYNKSAMLDLEFLIAGQASLSDYYNYGFDDLEESCFCIRVECKTETSSEDWYIYLDRKDFKKLYDKLVQNKTATVIGICEIPKVLYEDGQGNLAIGNTMYW